MVDHQHNTPCDRLYEDVLEKESQMGPWSSSYKREFYEFEGTVPTVTDEQTTFVVGARTVEEKHLKGIGHNRLAVHLRDLCFGHIFSEELWEQEPWATYSWQYMQNMNQGYKHIPVREMVFSHFCVGAKEDVSTSSFGRLLQEFVNRTATVTLWTMGDRHDAGYQLLKVHYSGLVSDVLRGMNEHPGIASQKQSGFEKMDIIIDEFKDKPLEDKIRKVMHEAAEKGEKEQIVMVMDDRLKNLDKIASLVERLNRSEHNPGVQLRYHPVWVAYSREGHRLAIMEERAARGDDMAQREVDSIHERCLGKTVLRHEKDLLGKEFLQTLDHAHAFVDFDGVVVDNRDQRPWQVWAPVVALKDLWSMLVEDYHKRKWQNGGTQFLNESEYEALMGMKWPWDQ